MKSFEDWLSLEDTATFLGLGKTALYALAREGRIPARKTGKKWIFEKAGLEKWLRTNRPVEQFFLGLDFKIDGNDYLRDPQRDGYSSARRMCDECFQKMLAKTAEDLQDVMKL